MSGIYFQLDIPDSCRNCLIVQKTKSGLRCPIASRLWGFSCTTSFGCTSRPTFCPIIPVPFEEIEPAQGGDTNLQRIRTATEDEIVDFIDEYGSNFEIERYCVPERVGCEELPDNAAAPCRECIRRWLHEKPERRA